MFSRSSRVLRVRSLFPHLFVCFWVQSPCICKPGGLCWHSRMPTECPIWKINSVSHLSQASLTLVFTDDELALGEHPSQL